MGGSSVEPWLTKSELARELRISTRTVTRLALPHVRVGGQNRYRRSEVEAVLAAVGSRDRVRWVRAVAPRPAPGIAS